MIVNKNKLLRKMWVTPRLNLKCDGMKIRLAYVRTDEGAGWVIENFNGDKKTEFYKGKLTKEIVDMIADKFKSIDITWSRSF